MTSTNPFEGRRMLLVEDDYWLAAELVPQLRSAGIDVIGPTASVEQAMQALEETPHLDGAILDINLQGKTVFPLADELQRRNVPFLFATGYSKDVVPGHHADKLLLAKPIDVGALTAAFSQMLRRSAPELETEPAQSENHLLATLGAEEFERVSSFLTRVHLEQGTELERPDDAIRHVDFIESGVASVLASTPTGREIETGIIGREGVTGAGALVQGDTQGPFRVTMQVEGSALRMDAEDFSRLTRQLPALQLLALRFARSFAIQVAHTALANGLFKLEARLARWLLMIDDRVDGSRIGITHEFLAAMLGVRRPGVTVALQELEGRGVIRSLRGEVVIRDRSGLLAIADGAYQTPEEEYERLIGRPIHKGSWVN